VRKKDEGMVKKTKRNQKQVQEQTQEQNQEQAQKPVQVHETAVIRWLRRIFSLQTISVLAALVAAYFAYKSYQDSQPSPLSVIYEDKSLTLDGHFYCFENLIIPSTKDGILLDFAPFNDQYMDMRIPNGFPLIFNDTKKGINNFKLDVDVNYKFDVCIKPEDICPDYEIIEDDTISREMKLKYKHNVLNAKSFIPLPIKRVRYTEHNTLDEDSYSCLRLELYFACDGLSEQKKICINYNVSFIEGDYRRNTDEQNDYLSEEDSLLLLDELFYFNYGAKHRWIPDEQIDKFLNDCYENGYFAPDEDYYIVSILDRYLVRVVRPSRITTFESFEEYKKKVFEAKNAERDTIIR